MPIRCQSDANRVVDGWQLIGDQAAIMIPGSPLFELVLWHLLHSPGELAFSLTEIPFIIDCYFFFRFYHLAWPAVDQLLDEGPRPWLTSFVGIFNRSEEDANLYQIDSSRMCHKLCEDLQPLQEGANLYHTGAVRSRLVGTTFAEPASHGVL